MKNKSGTPIIRNLDIDVTLPDLTDKIKTSRQSDSILKEAEKTFERVNHLWKPRMVMNWFDIHDITDTVASIKGHHTDYTVRLDLGKSISFLKQAREALISVYTAGDELENASKEASSKGDHLSSYLIDLIGLVVLDKAGDHVKEAAEKKARNSGWGVSPFLSPGSVHGWELEDQGKLCALLPIEQIQVSLIHGSVISPFKTISCLIGTGPGYDSVKVGSTCDLCSKRDSCPMKQCPEPK